MDQWSAAHRAVAMATFTKDKDSRQQRNEYSDDILTTGDTEQLLLATPPRTGHISYESRLPCRTWTICHDCAGTRKHWTSTATIGLRSPRRSARRHSVALNISSASFRPILNLIYIFTPTNYTPYKNCQTAIFLQKVHFVSNRSPEQTSIPHPVLFG